MITSENISILIQILTLGGIVFAIYTTFRRPQEKSEVNDAVFDEKIKSLASSTDTKIDTLKDIVVNLRDNHLHTVESKIDNHISESQTAALNSAKLMGSIEAKLDMLIKK